MRTHGRRLYPDTLSERRVLMRLGGAPLYVPRRVNVFMMARKLARVARGDSPDMAFARDALAGRKPPQPVANAPSGSNEPAAVGA
jgi:hypothetical protein